MTGLRWVRLDATFPANHKILTLAGRNQYRAIALYTCALAWSGGQGTNGHIPRGALPFLHGRPVDARHLIDAGLWHANGDGWTIHDWRDYQPTDTEQAKTDRLRKARAAANIRWHGTPDPR